MRKAWIILASALTLLAAMPAYGAQWVRAGGEDWYYVNENGQRLRNTFSEDGYYVDNQGKMVPLRAESEKDVNLERSSNMFFKYLETGDSKYLHGSEYITLPEPRLYQYAIQEDEIRREYVDYLSCIGSSVGGKLYSGASFQTNKPCRAITKIGFDAGKSYPDAYLNAARIRAEQDPSRTLDENNVPLYLYNIGSMYERGDFKPVTGAKNKGIQVHELVKTVGTSEPQTGYYITQRDAYKVYKDFIDMATSGTENLSEYDLAEHLRNVVTDYLYYADTLYQEHQQGRTSSPNDRRLLITILAGAGVCENYADLYQHLCDITGLECYEEIGKSNGEDHIWNLVKADGKWYHVDCTFADGNSEYDRLMTECHINGNDCDLITGVRSTNSLFK